MNYDRISIVVNRSILTTVLLRLKSTSCLILPHFAKSIVFRMKNLGSQNLAKLGISRRFEIGEIYDKSFIHLPRQHMSFLKKAFIYKVFGHTKVQFMPNLYQLT